MERSTMDTAGPSLRPPRHALLREVAELLRDVTGEDDAWAGRITEATGLEDDLWLESVELTALGERMRHRYGDGVDLPAFLAERDLDQLIALTVGDLVTLVAQPGGQAGAGQQ